MKPDEILTVLAGNIRLKRQLTNHRREAKER